MTMMEAPHSGSVGTYAAKPRPDRDDRRGSALGDAWELPSIDGLTGGLIIVGPTATEVGGLDDLLASPLVEGVEAVSARMSSWHTVTNEVIELSRHVSKVIRSGRTAVVYLDSHLGDAEPLDEAAQQFVCARMGQILIGLADTPAFVALHGEVLAAAIVAGSLGDNNAVAINSIDGVHPVWSLTNCRMFPDLKVALCSDDRNGASLLRVLDWFESCRAPVDITLR